MTVGIIILLSILMIIGVFITSISYYLFFKVAHKALKPIKLLNSRMRMLMTFKNSEFSSDQTFLTSEESRKLYELFKEIIIA